MSASARHGGDLGGARAYTARVLAICTPLKQLNVQMIRDLIHQLATQQLIRPPSGDEIKDARAGCSFLSRELKIELPKEDERVARLRELCSTLSTQSVTDLRHMLRSLEQQSSAAAASVNQRSAGNISKMSKQGLCERIGSLLSLDASDHMYVGHEQSILDHTDEMPGWMRDDVQMSLMLNPRSTTKGHTFDQSTLEKCERMPPAMLGGERRYRCPMTREPIDFSKTYKLEEAIDEWLHQNLGVSLEHLRDFQRKHVAAPAAPPAAVAAAGVGVYANFAGMDDLDMDADDDALPLPMQPIRLAAPQRAAILAAWQGPGARPFVRQGGSGRA